MIIQTDDEGKKIVEDLCNIALKMGGLSNLQGVTQVLQTIKIIKNDEDKKIVKRD